MLNLLKCKKKKSTINDCHLSVPHSSKFNVCVDDPKLPTLAMAASKNVGSWLAALWGNDFAGSVFARRHHTKLISDRLLRQRNGLMIFNKIEQVLVITKQIFYYYSTDFSLEITSKVQKVNQKYTFTHKLTTKCSFQIASLFFSSTVT